MQSWWGARPVSGGPRRTGDRPAGPPARRVTGDVVLWAATAAPIGAAGASPPYSGRGLATLAGGLVLLTVAVAVSRRWPLAALVLVVSGSLFDGNFLFAIPVFSYLTGRRSVTATPAAVAFAAIAAGGTVLNLGLLGTGAATWFLLVSVLLFAGVFPWLVGRYRRQQAALVEAGRRHAEARDRERRGAAERIRLRERARIAQEMHDSLGHDLSLIALRAAALEVAGDLDARHRAAAGELRASVAAATERLHGIIGLLREEAGPASVRPADETLVDLVEGAREAGMAVRLEPADGLPGLPPATAHAAHRLVREALTNAARYAPGAPVTVALAPAGDRVEVSVDNARPPAGPLPGPPASGSGLLALAERVRLAGGTLAAGPRPDGGFGVRARLPLVGGPPRDVPPVDDAHGAAGPPPWTGPGWSAGAEPPTEADRRLGDARRRVRRSLLVALAAPAGLGLVLSLVYYPVVTAGTVLDEGAYARMPVGAERAELTGLPRRQLDPPPGAARPGCEHYTDGNFPLAEPTWRLCFAGGRLVSKERIDG